EGSRERWRKGRDSGPPREERANRYCTSISKRSSRFAIGAAARTSRGIWLDAESRMLSMMILNLKFAPPSRPPMSLSRTVLAVLPGKSADERILALRVEHGTVAVVPACEASSEESSDGEILSFEAFRRSRP